MFKKGYKQTITHRKRIGKAMKNRILSKEWRNKIGLSNSISHRGIKLSEKHKKRIKEGVRKSKGFKHGLSLTKEYSRFRCSSRRILLRNAQGDLTFEKWEKIKKKYNHTCLCCKKKEPEIILTVDHIVPLVKGGKNSCDNVQPLCIICNKIKFTKVVDFRTVNNT
jgi:5-methylcytosine-specific restriction endonuclease McrA